MHTESGKDHGKPNRKRLTAGACAFLLGAALGVGGTVLYAKAASNNKVKCKPASQNSWHCHNYNPFGKQCHGDEAHVGGPPCP